MNLSPFLYGLSQLIGLPATLVLVEHYGGICLPVPKKVDEEHRLAQLIGLENAQKLAQAYGGEKIAIALHQSGDHKQHALQRRARIRELREQGLSHSQIARELKTTDRTVRNVLGKEADDRQKTLF